MSGPGVTDLAAKTRTHVYRLESAIGSNAAHWNEPYPDEAYPARCDLSVCFAQSHNFRAGIVLRTVLVRRLDTSDPCCCPPKQFFPGYHPAPCLMALGLGPRRIRVFIEHESQTLC